VQVTAAGTSGQVLGGNTAAAPSMRTMTAVLDDAFTSTQGSVLYRNASVWTPLAPGTNGQVLTSGGAAANLSWSTVSGVGTVTSVDAAGGTTGMTFTGGPITGAGTLTMSGTLVAPNGGTGLSSYAQGDLLYASDGTTISKLAKDTNATRYISNTGSSNNPAWAQVALGTGVSGQLPLANGGTAANLTDPNADRILFWDDSAGAVTWLAPSSGVNISGTSIIAIETPNPQTGTSYTLLDGDRGKLVTIANAASVALALPQAGASSEFVADWYCDIQNRTSPLVVITPTTSTIDGAATLTLGPSQGVRIVSDGTNYYTARYGCVGRQTLTAARTYYVRTDGNDSNTGLANTSGGAFLTIQKAVDTVAALDLSIYDVTIQVGNGTYTTTTNLKSTVGAGTVTIQGDVGTPSNVVISTTSANNFLGNAISGKWGITGLKMQTTTSGSCISLLGSTTVVSVGAVEFGACADTHCLVQEGASLTHTSSYTISGGAARHWNAATNATITIASSLTCTLTGTPAFSQQFVQSTALSFVRGQGITYVGSATGQRFNVANNAVINTNGGGANFFPGSTAGAGTNSGTSPYGLYI
jgi:hypothetical protein